MSLATAPDPIAPGKRLQAPPKPAVLRDRATRADVWVGGETYIKLIDEFAGGDEQLLCPVDQLTTQLPARVQAAHSVPVPLLRTD